MATFQSYYQPQDQQPFTYPHAFTYGFYDTVREKTPTDSLINHTGLSPIPLTTTPPLTRNHSHQPELPRDQPPDQLLWDNGSFSDSPTVRTPDGESFEVEMLDSESAMRTFYQQNDLAMTTTTTQVAHNTIPAVDPNTFFTPQGAISNHAVDAAFHETMASHTHQFHQPYNAHATQASNIQTTTQPSNHAFMDSFHNQTYRQEPWNDQGPSRSSMIARPGALTFDTLTDTLNYPNYFPDVEFWTANSTDPSYMTSPSEQLPSQGNVFQMSPQNPVHQPQVQIPQTQPHNPSLVDMHITRPSPPPDLNNFVNYNASSSIFTDTYITPNQYPPSSPGNSSNGHYPTSPFQTNISPSAASPSSDGVFSYHLSDSEMMLDPVPVQQFHQMQPYPPTNLNMNYAHVRSAEAPFGAEPTSEPEPEPSHGGATIKITGKSGGRTLGTHLEPTVAKAAHDMRKITACWHCVLQRDKCGPGEICERCLKRSQRPNADCGLGCSRIKLIDLAMYFLPGLVTQMHEDAHLKHFVSQYIHQWGNVELTVYMTCGQRSMPRIPVKVYEFVPRGTELLAQIQYVTDPRTNKRVSVVKQSPALGMVHINHNEEKQYDRYVSEIVDHHLDAFGELCWMEDDNDFLQKLFKLMTRVKPKSEEESKLLREVFRLVVVTFIMSHTLTIAEESKHQTLSRMQSYGGAHSYVQNYTSPRMTNRQLKYFFARLQKQIQVTVLNKLQQIFKSSKGCDKWLAAFVAVLGMCMALEDQQKTIHLVMSTKATTENTDMRDAQAQADIACQEIDARMHFVQQIFRWKYNRKHNPIVNVDHDWEKEVGFGDASSVNFVRQVAQLVKENTDFLQQQQRVSISCNNQTKYSSRLVGQFLLSFWLPNA